MTCTTFTLFRHTLSSWSSFGSPLTQHRWAGVTVHWTPGTCVRERSSTVHRCHISFDAHPIKKEGGQLPQSTDHLFKQPFVPRPPGSWQQLAARTGHSSPACQSVHYGSMGVESQALGNFSRLVIPKAGQHTCLVNTKYATGDFVYAIVELYTAGICFVMLAQER